MKGFSRCTTPVLLLVVCLAGRAPAAEWHHPLYLDGGGFWKGRVPVLVHNHGTRAVEGQPVAVTVGSGPSEAALQGQAAEAVRVVDEQGVEMLFGLTGPDGARVTRGPIPAGSTLVLPAECASQSTARYYVYFDNPAAGAVPDFLSARLDLANGDVELGDQDAPSAWRHDPPDPEHRASWTSEDAQSGRRCLKTVVADGAEPTWIATRQGGIHVVGGAKYVMRAWVKAEKVKGFAGWYLHVGNRENSMLIAPMLSGGEGTYDWKQVTAEFTAPPDADRADLGTVLRGTGTAWFDNVSLECLQPGNLRAQAERAEHASLEEVGLDAPWLSGRPGDGLDAHHRALVRVFNFSSKPTGKPLVAIDLGRLEARMRGRLNRESIRVGYCGEPVRHFVYGDMLLFEGSVPARTANCYYVYFSDDPQIESDPVAEQAPFSAAGNLVQNAGFEQGAPLPDAWSASGPPESANGITYGLDDPGRRTLGKRCARMHVPHGVRPT